MLNGNSHPYHLEEFKGCPGYNFSFLIHFDE